MSAFLRALWRGIVLLFAWRGGWLRKGRRPHESDPSQRTVGASARAERAVVLLLLGCAAAGMCFTLLFILEPQTQLLGVSLGAALAMLAAALMLSSKLLVPQETKVEERPLPGEPQEVSAAAQELRSGAEGITRRRLIGAAALAGGTGVTAAAVVPIVALGPRIDSLMRQSGWHRGRRLVDDLGRPVLAADVRTGSFLTAFPEGADKEQLGAPVVLVRVNPALLRLPPRRRGWAPQGILAYSKICTHAGCAVALYRKPTFPVVEPKPALVCPCHYSTFDPARAGAVIYGPAGRPLPQLPLMIDGAGYLRAAGNFSGPVGPSWWGVRSGGAR